MAKQITIKRNGVEGSASADFINTQVAGGSANWMPEDEANIGVIRITRNGEYVPSEYGLYGFHMVAVQVPGGAGGQSGPSGEYVVPLPATEVTASVIGVDPVDGAVYRVEIQDVDGVPTLVKTKVADTKADYKPTSIRILLKPAKLSYKVGEKIQYAGLVVELLDSGGHTFVDERFPQGIISWSPVKNLLHPEYDLITPVEYAALGSFTDRFCSEVGIESITLTTTSEIEFKWVYNTSMLHSNYKTVISANKPCVGFALVYSSYDPQSIYSGHNSHAICIADKEPFEVTVTRTGGGSSHVSGPRQSHEFTHNGLTVYYEDSISGSSDHDNQFTSSVPITYCSEQFNTALEGDTKLLAWEMFYGNIDTMNEVPVQWNSPYDNQTYEDTFEIEVTDG